MSRATDVLTQLLPLRIERAEIVDPTLLIGGRDWSLSATCLWRWFDVGGQVVSSDSPNAADLVWDLIGEEIISVHWHGPAALGLDPGFDLRTGGAIDLLSDATYDTWVLRAADVVIVGPYLVRTEP